MIFDDLQIDGRHAPSPQRAWRRAQPTRSLKPQPAPSRHGVLRRCAALGACLAASLAATTRAQDVIRWHNAVTVAGRLEMPLSTGVSWSGQALRDGLRSFSRSDGVRIAMLLDRRADPSQPMELRIVDGTLGEALDRVADFAKLGWCQIGPVIYFGPPTTAHKLRTVVEIRKEELPKVPSSMASKLRRVKAWRWDDLATPRELIEELAHEGELKLEGLERIPHDLWAGADLPPMSALERMSLVLAGYDLTFTVEPPATIRLVPMPAKASITRSYSLGAASEAEVETFRKKFPDAELRVEGWKLVVVGRAEDHAAIATALTGKKTKPVAKSAPPKLSQIRVTITYKQQPVSGILNDVAKKLSLDLVIDREAITAAGLSLDTRVSVELTNVPVAELLAAITKPAGLAFEIRGRTVRIVPQRNGGKPKVPKS